MVVHCHRDLPMKSSPLRGHSLDASAFQLLEFMIGWQLISNIQSNDKIMSLTGQAVLFQSKLHLFLFFVFVPWISSEPWLKGYMFSKLQWQAKSAMNNALNFGLLYIQTIAWLQKIWNIVHTDYFHFYAFYSLSGIVTSNYHCMKTLLTGQFTQKSKFSHHLLTLKYFQTCMNVFVQANTKEDILKKVCIQAVLGHHWLP